MKYKLFLLVIILTVSISAQCNNYDKLVRIGNDTLIVDSRNFCDTNGKVIKLNKNLSDRLNNKYSGFERSKYPAQVYIEPKLVSYINDNLVRMIEIKLDIVECINETGYSYIIDNVYLKDVKISCILNDKCITIDQGNLMAPYRYGTFNREFVSLNKYTNESTQIDISKFTDKNLTREDLNKIKFYITFTAVYDIVDMNDYTIPIRYTGISRDINPAEYTGALK